MVLFGPQILPRAMFELFWAVQPIESPFILHVNRYMYTNLHVQEYEAHHVRTRQPRQSMHA